MAFPTSQTLIEESHGDEEHEHLPDSHKSESIPDDVDSHYAGTPIKFLPLRHVYSTTSPCSGSSIVASKKVRASRKLPMIHTCLNDDFQKEQEKAVEEEAAIVVEEDKRNDPRSPKVTRVYSRRKRKKPNFNSLVERFEGEKNVIGVDDVMVVKEEPVDEGFVDCDEMRFVSKKKRRLGSSELVKLGVDSKVLFALNNCPRLRESRFQYNVAKTRCENGKRRKCTSVVDHSNHNDLLAKKWFQLAFDGVDPMRFVGLKCKVYWPLDNAWYKASIVAYDVESKRHSLKYEDGDEEELVLSDEQIKFFISKDDMKILNLRGKTCMDDDDPDYSQLIGLAATVDEGRELEPGDIIWAKLSGFSMWPAVIMDESLVSERKGLNKNSGGKSVPVQFFGTHDFARIPVKQIVSFVKGLVSCFHLKSKTLRFLRSLKEAKIYLNEQKLPKSMLNMQQACEDVEIIDSIDISWKNEDLSDTKAPAKFSSQKLLSDRYQNMPSGYRPVRIDWKDLDRCNVCHMDEEYENNLFLQCDKCRMMVHARCYGEEFVEGVLWLCNLCCAGASESSPPCHLCPVVGGAMKPTTDGHWAHLACAIWIPETCLSDIKRMEPIDGLSRINKDRWKLLCSICGVAYGACIQCSNNSCRVAYHPLCARAAGLCVELEDEDRLHLIPVDEDSEEQCIRLLSFCKKHKQPSCGRPTPAERNGELAHQYSSYNPSNESGCARCEPYDYSARRGRKEPEVLAAASAKRLFIENRPYLVGGYSQHDSLARVEEKTVIGSKFCLEVLNRISQQDIKQNILSMADKYKYMKETVRKRLTFGKSRIHGFGIFTKQSHKAGDMVIEYTGEIVRPSVADWRENFIYNLLVGAGTYMFRIDDERVIDATRTGSIAHLINHSCEPNCYSRNITVNGDEHIIIFAKRDIKQWEELTYDYRFFSIDERLSCYCGFKGCRGVVNDIEAEEQAAKLCVPRNELIDWTGE